MKNLVALILFTFVSLGGIAQPHKINQEDFERYKAQRVAYMTDKMQLTSEEAQKFWPLYNEFDTQRGEYHMKRRDLENKIREDYDKLSTKDFQKMNDEIVNIYLQEAQLVKTYNEKFLKVLPVSKVILIGPTENEFRFKMIREFRQRERDDNPPE